FRRALALVRDLGPEHPTAALILNNLGAVLIGKKDYAGADECLREALAIYQKTVGPKHPEIATTLSNLGDLRFREHELGGTLTYANAGLVMFEQTVGPNHPLLGDALVTLAKIRRAQGRTKAAIALAERAVRIPDSSAAKEAKDLLSALRGPRLSPVLKAK